MSQPSSNIAPAVSSVPWATPETSSMDAPGDRFGYAPGRLRVPAADFSGPTFPGTQYVDVAAIFADGGYNSPKTFDPGMTLYAVSAILSGAGLTVLRRRKR